MLLTLRPLTLAKPDIRVMQLTDYQALGFQCYGTLIDKASGVYSALRPLLTKGHITLGRDEVMASFAQCEAAQQLATPEASYRDILAGAHRRLAKTWGIVSFDDEHVLFGESVLGWPVFADVPAALQYLKRYFKLVLLTHADRTSCAAGKRQLPVKFDAVFTAPDVGVHKPASDNCQFILEKLAPLGVAKAHLLLVATGPDDALATLSSCGIASAWLDRHADSGLQESLTAIGAARTFRFASMVDMVRAHQEQLVA